MGLGNRSGNSVEIGGECKCGFCDAVFPLLSAGHCYEFGGDLARRELMGLE